jgi:maleylpyruvate isomerase
VTGAVRWMDHGTVLLRETIGRLDDAALAEPSLLPGWSRRHVLAHVAANADALRRLARWAGTGQEERMYASPEQRSAEIETGSTLPAGALRSWVAESARLLAAGLTGLTEAGWRAEVVTAQGRIVPATEIPWLRAREVMVHTVDLAAGTGFGDLPEDFLARLTAEVAATRAAGPGPDVTRVSAPLPALAAWLTGRPAEPGAPGGLPGLPPWL